MWQYEDSEIKLFKMIFEVDHDVIDFHLFLNEINKY